MWPMVFKSPSQTIIAIGTGISVIFDLFHKARWLVLCWNICLSLHSCIVRLAKISRVHSKINKKNLFTKINNPDVLFWILNRKCILISNVRLLTETAYWETIFSYLKNESSSPSWISPISSSFPTDMFFYNWEVFENINFFLPTLKKKGFFKMDVSKWIINMNMHGSLFNSKLKF